MLLSEIIYNGELSVTAYIILAVMLLILIGGFFWCFYRAMTSADNTEEQHPDEV